MREVKQNILSRTIEEDQQAVINMWVKTFKHNDEESEEIKIARLAFAMIACSDFKIKHAFATEDRLVAPSTVLTLADYLSHASRIVIDYQALSQLHREELLAYFPRHTAVSRTATHAVSRDKTGKVSELKGAQYGILGLMPSIISKPRDFGINIAMGGNGQSNFAGRIIKANGYSGHWYYHLEDTQQIMMMGLEQAKPLQIRALFRGDVEDSSDSEDAQSHIDQFGQQHSVIGKSDVFTAASSIYFSDPVYQAKLMDEHHILPPEKYDGMHVKITDVHWDAIKMYMGEIRRASVDHGHEALVRLLNSRPSTANGDEISYRSIAEFDFKGYFDRIFEYFAPQNDEAKEIRLKISRFQEMLLISLNHIKSGRVHHYKDFLERLFTLIEWPDLPKMYCAAMVRLNRLFLAEESLNQELKSIRENLLLEKRSAFVQEVAEELYKQCLTVQHDLSSDCVVKEGIEDYKKLLDLKMEILQRYRLSEEYVSPVPLAEEFIMESEILFDEIRMLLINRPRLSAHFILEELRLELLHTQQEAQETAIKINEMQDRNEVSIRRMLQVFPLLSHLATLEAKAKNLEQRKHVEVSDAVKSLIVAIKSAVKEFAEKYDESDAEALATFKRVCKDQIEERRATFEKHRGFKTFFSNLLLAIALLGVGYIVAAGINRYRTGHCSFFRATDTQEKLGHFMAAVNAFSVENTEKNTSGTLPS
jgi:hypothetical protein